MRLRCASIAVVVLGVTACSTSTRSSASSGPTTTAPAAPTTGASAAVRTTSTSAPAPDGAPRDLPVTPAVRAALLDAGAAFNQLPASAYDGLRPGTTYYAYDPATRTYWAGAALSPSSSSLRAQVSAQDDGAYLLFEKPVGGVWRVYDDGLGGIGGTACPVTVPAGVVAVWGWPAGRCRPATI